VTENISEDVLGLLDLDILEAEQARRSLRIYIEKAWPVVEPGRAFISGWHIDAICEHLEAVTRGEIHRLLINIPPRHMKSLLVSVFWPTWVWATAPESRWIFASYAEKLSTRDSLKCRRIIQSQWYQKRWGDRFTLTSDQNVKTRFENDKTGFRLATSVGGLATGEGGDFLVIDDAHKADESHSDTQLEKACTWHDEVWSTRLNDEKTGARVVIGQRIHERDLPGHLLEKGGWEKLILPTEYEPTTHVTSIGFKDPREKEGDLLWAERFGPEAIAQAKLDLGSYAFAGQHQQRPAPREGGIFDRAWFSIVRAAPADARRVRYWDKAGTECGGAFTAGVRMSTKGGIYYVEDVVRGQWSSGKRNRAIRTTAEIDGHETHVWVEQEPGSGGKESAEYTIQELAGFTVRAERPTGDKVERAQPLSAQAEAGNVVLVKGQWNEAFLAELELFPNGAYKDQADAASGAFNKLALECQATRGGEMVTL